MFQRLTKVVAVVAKIVYMMIVLAAISGMALSYTQGYGGYRGGSDPFATRVLYRAYSGGGTLQIQRFSPHFSRAKYWGRWGEPPPTFLWPFNGVEAFNAFGVVVRRGANGSGFEVLISYITLNVTLIIPPLLLLLRRRFRTRGHRGFDPIVTEAAATSDQVNRERSRPPVQRD